MRIFLKTIPPLIIGLMIVVFALSFSGCDKNEAADNPKAQDKDPIGTISLSIIFPDGAGIDNIEEDSLPIYSEDTKVLDLLQDYCKSKELPVVIEKSSFTCVTGISGVFENDYGNSTGWVFEVNGEMSMEDAATCGLTDGDAVVWKYVSYEYASM